MDRSYWTEVMVQSKQSKQKIFTFQQILMPPRLSQSQLSQPKIIFCNRIKVDTTCTLNKIAHKMNSFHFSSKIPRKVIYLRLLLATWLKTMNQNKRLCKCSLADVTKGDHTWFINISLFTDTTMGQVLVLLSFTSLTSYVPL